MPSLADSTENVRPKSNMAIASKSLALLAIIFYIPGVFLPAMRIEKMGRIRETSLFDSFWILVQDSEWMLAAVVLISALILPPVKLFGLVWLEWEIEGHAPSSRWRSVLEFAGRFGLLEVFLAALLIAIIRFDSLIRFQARTGLYLFVMSAVAGLAAALLLSHRTKAHSRQP